MGRKAKNYSGNHWKAKQRFQRPQILRRQKWRPGPRRERGLVNTPDSRGVPGRLCLRRKGKLDRA